jgi:hypothetical protein
MSNGRTYLPSCVRCAYILLPDLAMSIRHHTTLETERVPSEIRHTCGTKLACFLGAKPVLIIHVQENTIRVLFYLEAGPVRSEY